MSGNTEKRLAENDKDEDVHMLDSSSSAAVTVTNANNYLYHEQSYTAFIEDRNILDLATRFEEGETFDIYGEQTIISQKSKAGYVSTRIKISPREVIIKVQHLPHDKRNNNNNNLFNLLVYLSENYHNGEIVQANVKVEDVDEEIELLLQLTCSIKVNMLSSSR
ncbi:hypothetical protein EDC94DRAFT_645443 [Helicostylum pulchrum]|nr:hypothetical protein EDC94DRAFT_645443 [Helicostylum pulchrum]